MAINIPMTNVPIFPNMITHFGLRTNVDFRFQLQGCVPIIDIHSHIQSNNAAPLTLQWGLVLMLIASFLDEKIVANTKKFGEHINKVREFVGKKDETKVEKFLKEFDPQCEFAYTLIKSSRTFLASVMTNMTALSIVVTSKISKPLGLYMAIAKPLDSLQEFGRIGTLDTDMVAKLLMRDNSNLMVKKRAYVSMDEEILKKMIEKREDSMEKFEIMTDYYYKQTGIVAQNFFVILPMDLSYAHYWGNHGLPIYFPVIGLDTYLYINDYLYAIDLRYQLGERFTKFVEDYKKKVVALATLKNEIDKKIQKAEKYIIDNIDEYSKDINTASERLGKELEHFHKDLIDCTNKIVTNAVIDSVKSSVDIVNEINTFKKKVDAEIDKLEKEIQSKLNDIMDELKQTLEKYSELNKELRDDIIKKIKQKCNEGAEEYEKNHDKTEILHTLLELLDEILKSIDEKSKENLKVTMDAIKKIKEKIESVIEQVEKTTAKIIDEAANTSNTLQKIVNDFNKNRIRDLAGARKKLKSDLASLENTFRSSVQQISDHVNRNLVEIKDAIKKELQELEKLLEKVKNYLKKMVDHIQGTIMLCIYGWGKLIAYDIDLKESADFFEWSEPVVLASNKALAYKKGELANFEKYKTDYLTKKFNHFLDLAPGNETKEFEDYPIQIDKTIASAVRYPLEIFPFYHCDPRRLYSDEAYIKDLIANIQKQHGFFFVDRRYIDDRNLTTDIKLTPVNFTDDYLKNQLFGNINKTKKDDVEKMIHPNGLFWGIKMYTQLGYAPFLFDANDNLINNTFKYLQPNHHKYLEELFRTCAANGIPITCHGSPRAMTIADSYLYLREKNKKMGAANKKFYDALFYLGASDVVDSLNLIDQEFVSPNAWRKVLAKEGLSKLKINLAHFSGEGAWIKKDPVYDWREDLCKLMQTYKKVYTDLACFSNKNDTVDKFIDEMAQYLNGTYGKILKNRVMIGSDWPMFEKDGVIKGGVGEYYGNMFNVCKKVTKKLSNKYDVWHQFTVRNPMRFLGLIDDDEDNAGDDNSPKDVKLDKLEKHAALIKDFLNQKEEILLRTYGLSTADKAKILDSTFGKIQRRLSFFDFVTRSKIQASKDIKKNNELTILQG